MDVPRLAHPRATALAGVAVWLVCQAPVMRASQAEPPQQPTFTAGTVLVELDVTVTDDAGRPVRGLTKDDFVLRENGEVQPLDRADFVDVPMPAPRAAGTPVPVAFPPPDIATNVAGSAPPRAYVFVLDDLLTRAHRTARMRDAVERFIRDGMAPGDSGAVAFTGAESSAQDFTTDQARLIDAVQRFSGRAAATVADNIVGDGGSSPAPLLPDYEYVHNNRRTMDTLANAVMALSRLSGPRRAIVFVSEAHGLAFGDRDDKGADAGRLLSLAAANNVVIHVVDPSGLTGPKDDGDIGTAVIRPGDVLGRSSAYDGPVGPQELDDLRSLATQTGGVAVINTNGLQQGFARIVQASSTYYHLAYYPADTRPDGKFRRLDVHVNREGVRVVARRSYVIEKPSKKKAAMSKPDELLSSPLPVVGLGLHAQAAVLRKGQKDARAVVVIDVDGADLAFEERGDTRLETLEFWVVAIDSSGRVRDKDSGVSELRLTPERAAETTKRGLRLIADLSLGQGRYRVRIAARERQTGHAGSIFLDLDVPDFGKGGPHASSLVLTSAEEGLRPALDRNTSTLRELLPALPTATRRFTLDDSLVAALETYPTAADTRPPACRLELIADDGATVARQDFAPTGSDDGTWRCTPSLALRAFEPGNYRLLLSALTDGHAPLVRETALQLVRPEG